MNRLATKAIVALGATAFAASLAYSVFNFGSPIDPWRSRGLWATGVAALLCLLALAACRDDDPPHRAALGPRLWIPAACWTWLFAYAVFMLWNAKARHAMETFLFEPLEQRFPGGPGTISVQGSAGAPREIVVLALIFAVGWITARHGRLWPRLLKFLVLLGAAAALFGILHKVTGASAVWWLDTRHPETFFAPFVYNANAGAFLNLLMPLAVGAALSAASGERNRGGVWVWLGLAAFIAAATLITASKGAILALGGGIVLQILLHRRRLGLLLRETRRLGTGRKFEGAMLGGALAVGIACVLFIGWEFSLTRFGEFFDRLEAGGIEQEGRVQMTRILWQMAGPDAGGFWGYGPGTYPHLVPYFTQDLGDSLGGLWLTGHNDWLQMFVEWGWIGGTVWATLAVGSIVSGFRALRHRSRLAPGEAPLVRATIAGLVVTGLHSAIDFPFQIFGITAVAVLMAGFLWGVGARRG